MLTNSEYAAIYGVDDLSPEMEEMALFTIPLVCRSVQKGKMREKIVDLWAVKRRRLNVGKLLRREMAKHKRKTIEKMRLLAECIENGYAKPLLKAG